MTALVIVPLTLDYLGPERYGLWTTITSLAAFLIFADLGVGNGLLSAVARVQGEHDGKAVARLVASGVWILAGIGVAFAAIAVALSLTVDWASVFNVRDPVSRSEAAPAMLALGLCYAASLPLSAVTQTRSGFQEGFVNGIFTAVGNLLGLVLVVVAVSLRLGLPYIVLAFMGAPLAAGLVNAATLFRAHRELIPSWRKVSPAVTGALARSGAQFLILQLAMAGAFYSDTVIAASLIGPAAAAEYNVASTLFLVPMGLVAAGVAPLWPAYAEAMARGDTTWIRKTLRRSLAIGLLITVPSAILITLLADPILTVWIGNAVVPGSLLIIGVAVWTVLRGIGTGMAMLLNGLHLLRVQIGTAVVMAVLNVTLSVFLTIQIGVAGVILGTVIAYTAATVIPLGIYLPRVLARLDSPDASGRRSTQADSPGDSRPWVGQ